MCHSGGQLCLECFDRASCIGHCLRALILTARDKHDIITAR